MDVKLLFLAVVLLPSPHLTLCDPLFVLSAPNLLRVGSSENVFVEAQNYSGIDLNVRITVKNFPARDLEILSKSVTLTGDKYQLLTDIKIPDDQNLFSDDPLEKQYVYLQAKFLSVTLEKVVMVSFQSGYIFVQTDKPIYTPASTVRYRIFSLMPNMKPLNKSGITVQIMNPQDITVSSDNIFSIKGMMSGKYIIPEMASSGIWKVVTLFTNTPQKKFTTEFEVKEYVLPTFEVKLKPSELFFHVDNPCLEVNINAKYLFGQNVEGNAFVVFGVMNDQKKTSIPTSLQKVQIKEGAGTAELTKQMITKPFPNITELVGQSIYVSVSVLTESGSEMVEAERRGIQIVASPYTIHFKKTPHFFKPGMPFDVSVYVTNPDQTPAEKVEVEVNPGAVKGQTKANGIARVTVNTLEGSSTLEITAKTKDPQLKKDEYQAMNKMTAQAYKTKGSSMNYLHISIGAAELQIGETVTAFLNSGQEFKDQVYTYMILSKGQIIHADRFKRAGQTLVALPVPVTKDMVPSFRFVAYYQVGSSEVVSDSVWVDVKDTCMGKLKLEVKNKRNYYETGEKVELQITGDPEAKVGLVVVDKAVHILNKNRLTQTQIWDVIEKHDIGCTAGGGRDSMGVFTDAGLLFASNTAGGTNTRTVPGCPMSAKRKRRAEGLLQITNRLAGQYSGELKQCCVDGMRSNKLGYSCERRATYIVDEAECVKAFLHCCNEMKTRKDLKTEEEELILARNDDDDEVDYTDSEDIVSRTHFPESWLWDEIQLYEKSNKKNIFLKDSITTWQILAVSLSPEHGICVAEPEEMVVYKSFFIDLKVPYSAVRGEQLEIKAIIHNYSPRNLRKVRVEFMETQDVCSSASKKGKYRTIVNVDKDSSIGISYVIIPMTLGHHDIEVKASIYEYEDGVKKTLKVVSEGVLIPLHRKNMDLNPIKNGEKPILIKAKVPADRVPDTPANMYISITGEEIAQTVEKAISGDFMGRFIFQPWGCGEQNMYRMTVPLIATHYLDSTNQWDAVGVERRNEAIQHIDTGYQVQMSYRKPDGSYSIWKRTPSSTWLTAYVAKVFAIANNLIAMDDEVICSALKWLVLNKQLPDGSFKEDAPVLSRGMVGGIESNDADASLTAFVVIAMQEGKEICAGSVSSLHESIRKAVSFLEGRLLQLTNPYAVAMTSYAMANAEKLNKGILLSHSTQEEVGRSWTVPEQHHHSLEATAYAVLALVKAKDFDKAGEAVHWIARQQTHYGEYGTTQATIMVFQAVAEYRTQVKDQKNFSLNVELSMAGRSKPVKWTLKRDNIHLTRTDKVDINKDFTVTARGTGTATLSVLTLYYARPVEKKSDCTFFDLIVKMEKDPETKPGAITSYIFTMDFIYKNDKINATMTILDIGLPTGFDVKENDLNELSSGKDRYIQKYEKNTVLSERGSLILYLNKVSHKEREKIVFQMHKMLNVGLLQPAAVTIYEYYSPDARCTKFYHPERTDGAIYRLCKGDLCQCAEGNCTYQMKNKVDENLRLNKSCEPGMDYEESHKVYKVKVVKMNQTQESDTYDMKVEHVLKEGSDEGVEGNMRQFLARPNCRGHLGLVIDKSYLIMGKSFDMGGSLQYIFGEQTWLEYWPTRQESQTLEHRQRYIGIAELQHSLENYGCTT